MYSPNIFPWDSRAPLTQGGLTYMPENSKPLGARGKM